MARACAGAVEFADVSFFDQLKFANAGLEGGLISAEIVLPKPKEGFGVACCAVVVAPNVKGGVLVACCGAGLEPNANDGTVDFTFCGELVPEPKVKGFDPPVAGEPKLNAGFCDVESVVLDCVLSDPKVMPLDADGNGLLCAEPVEAGAGDAGFGINDEAGVLPKVKEGGEVEVAGDVKDVPNPPKAGVLETGIDPDVGGVKLGAAGSNFPSLFACCC